MRFVRVLGLLPAVGLILTGCATNTEDAVGPRVAASVRANKVEEIAALLPAEIRDSGRLVIASNIPYQPNEFKDASGRIVGFDVDLMNAVSRVLGVVPQYKESTFERIIPSLVAGTYDLGMSSFTDTAERERSVDFTDYFRAGAQWLRQAGRTNIGPEDACGRRVGVQVTTVEDTEEVPDKSAKCVARGKAPIVKIQFDEQPASTTALLLGQIDALSADLPVTAYAIKQTEGKLEAVGPVYNAAPYGWPVAKGSPLAKALQQALQYLIDNGDYRRICESWGVQAGMVQHAVINGARQ